MTLGTKETFNGAVKPSSIEQGVFEADIWANRTTEIPTNMQGRWAYDGSGLLIYAGFAPRGLAEGTDGWLLQKFTYTGTNLTKREIGYGDWTNRASESYA